METSTRALLESHGALGTASGDVAVGLAGRIDVALAAGESGNSVAALVREHRVTLAEVTRGGQTVLDPIDELGANGTRVFVHRGDTTAAWWVSAVMSLKLSVVLPVDPGIKRVLS